MVLIIKPHCSGTVTGKGSTQSVPPVAFPEQESVFSARRERIAVHVTPDWGLGAKGTSMVGGIRVEIWIITRTKD